VAEAIREVVGVFDDPEALEEAVFVLETHGFDRAAFSLLADEATVERELGHRYRRVDNIFVFSLVQRPDCGSGGHGFDSRCSPQANQRVSFQLPHFVVASPAASAGAHSEDSQGGEIVA
jgi:hypothetical protein